MNDIVKDFYSKHLENKDYFYYSDLKKITKFKDVMLNKKLNLDTKDFDLDMRELEKSFTTEDKFYSEIGSWKECYDVYTTVFYKFLETVEKIKLHIVHILNEVKVIDEIISEVYKLVNDNINDYFNEKEIEDYQIYINNQIHYYNKFILEDRNVGVIEFEKLGFTNISDDDDFFIKQIGTYKDKSDVKECISVNSVQQYLEAIKRATNYSNKDLDFFYRGQVNSEWNLEPGIFRSNLIKLEKKIYDDCISRLPENKKSNNVYENLLTIQHNDGPTRLLDITENPLVALFFACFDELEKEKEKDGIIYTFYEKFENIKYFNSDTLQIVANLARMKSDFQINKYESRKELIHCIKDYRPHFFDKIDYGDIKKSYVIKGVMSNDRIVNQNGSFIIVGMNETKEQPSPISQLSDIRIIIKSNRKKNFLDELNMLNISEDTIYPELNKRMKQLKNKWIKKIQDLEE